MDVAPEQSPRPRVTAQLRALRFDAGSLALNLVATLGRRTGVPIERLGTLDRLRDWCHGVGLRLGDDEITDRLLAELHTVREAAHDVVAAVLHDRVPRPESVALLNARARPAPPPPRLRMPGSGAGVEAVTRPLSGREAQAAVVRDLIALVGDPERRGALRECEAELCSMVYLDPGGSGRRRWCSMRRCGNSAKAARRRGRAATAP
ncbi:CGNR zinc finger domain-containing protein [Streptomyces sp. NA02950]|uniref:CGNR zinc finger domain-containing protein n=1 Tax=Streptomyces sp. NA02950 TaxID=2742137 RepID=UPI0015922A7E|nr:CGNR zinc finger domain-containing protein [Streptomyces sp. NA02950]QKV90952.1 CGNR zinc finger domain-containing protein [Streptomyces sp. NA02950]